MKSNFNQIIKKSIHATIDKMFVNEKIFIIQSFPMTPQNTLGGGGCNGVY